MAHRQSFKGSVKIITLSGFFIQISRVKTRDIGWLPADSTPHLDHRDPLFTEGASKLIKL